MTIPETVTIESLGNSVGGIARVDGFPAIFVKGALPGETVKVKLVKEKKNFITADLVSIATPSEHRIKPFCKYYEKCGGCSLQHLDYKEQLRWKRIWIEKAVRNLSTPEIEQPIASPIKKGYRNRVTFKVRNNQLTLHAFKGDTIPVTSCSLMNPTSAKALDFFLRNNLLTNSLQKVSFRGADYTPDALIELSGGFDKTISTNWPLISKKTKTGWQQLNNSKMAEKLGKHIYTIQPGAFFQVNTQAAEKLIELVLGYVTNTNDSTKKILDLFAGIGSFGIPLASKGFRVTAVEMNKEASDGCKKAITLNSINPANLKVVNTRDSNFLSNAIKNNAHFDTIITDPPRAGMGIKTSRQLSKLQASKIIYVSCNPFSAARDLAVLVEGNYSIIQITPVDLFPHTDHIETVFYLERG